MWYFHLDTEEFKDDSLAYGNSPHTLANKMTSLQALELFVDHCDNFSKFGYDKFVEGTFPGGPGPLTSENDRCQFSHSNMQLKEEIGLAFERLQRKNPEWEAPEVSVVYLENRTQYWRDWVELDEQDCLPRRNRRGGVFGVSSSAPFGNA